MGTVSGRIHSVETGGMVDGPGIRFVVFTQGCPLRCLYCHNPDTWTSKDGTLVTVPEILDQAEKYKTYMASSGGGITVTGGEPLMQSEFVRALILGAKARGMHTAVDTSGFGTASARKAVLPVADLVLLDIKSMSPDLFRQVAGVPIDSTLAALDELRDAGVPVWIRHVVVPGLTDGLDDAERMADVLTAYPNVERVEILPFHKMGEYKWEQLNRPYRLEKTSAPSAELMGAVRRIFTDRGLGIHE